MNKKMATNTYLSTITSNANRLNAPIKRHVVADWVTDAVYTCYLQETHFRSKDTHRLKVKGWKKIFHASGNEENKSWVAVVIPNKLDIKTKDTAIPFMDIDPKKPKGLN